MRMAPRNDKETVVFVTNVGVYNNIKVDEQFVLKSKMIMKYIIEKKIFNRPKDEIGIVLTGVEFGVNALDLEHVEDYHAIEIPTFNMVQKVLEITASDCFFTNWIDGVRAAVELIQRQAGESVRTTVILISDCPNTNELNENTRVDLSNTIVDKTIQFLWIGSKELNDLSENDLNESEKKLMNFCSLVLGTYMSFSHVLSKLEFYGTTTTNPTAWKCNLEIGELRIPTAIYLQILENVPTRNKWATISVNHKSNGETELLPVNKNLALVDRHREEHNKEEIIKGFMFGRTFIPLSDEDKMMIRNTTGPRSLKLYGFTHERNVSVEHRCGIKTNIMVPWEGGEKEFFSLVKAMADLNYVGLVRKVHTENSTPSIHVLYPQISDDGLKPWCFIMHELLYAEERAIVEPRSYEIILKSLNQQQLDSVDSLLDNMMLEPTVLLDSVEKLYEPGTVSSPDIQHIWNVISHRALKPNDPLPDPTMSILKLILPPDRNNETDVADSVTNIVSLFDLSKEPEYPPIENISTQRTQATTQKSAPTVPDENLPPQMDVDLDALFDD
ncbi:uncharacterized protein [Chelonus insularis]|uniref:uncharacterized protein n=1 Tax=Chelonus insularis TaxID=460826 RepID=UPI00158DCF5D|nr:uncharacterized protein LOC118071683 [Chelonus insularis]